MNSISVKNTPYILVDAAQSASLHVFLGDLLQEKITVTNQRELELILLALGENANVDMSQLELKKADIPDEYKHKLISSATWNYKKPEEAHNLIKKIPMPSYIKSILLSESIKPLDKEFVHKIQQENVLLSKPVVFGKLVYYKGYTDIKELKSDHKSDHLDGIKLFEAARQATLSSLHMAGLPFGGVMALTSNLVEYSKYTELSKPYFIQVLPVIREDQKIMHCAFDIIQDDVSCASGYVGIYHFKSRELFEQKRKNQT